jgi:purine nucleoside phosphorylase
MERHLRALVADRGYAASIAMSGRARVLERHTCAHRARELIAVLAQLGVRSGGDQRRIGA